MHLAKLAILCTVDVLDWQETCSPYQQHQFLVSMHLAKLAILCTVDVLDLHQIMLINTTFFLHLMMWYGHHTFISWEEAI